MNERKRGGLLELLRIAYRNIHRNRRRSALCIAAIAMSVLFIIAMAAFMDGMLESLRNQVTTFETGHILITSREYERKSLFMPLQYPIEISGLDLSALLARIEATRGVRAAFPRIRTRVTLLNSVVKDAELWGIDMATELPYNTFNLRNKNANDCLVAGRYPGGIANECAIGFRLAKRMGIEIGDKVQLRLVSSQFSNKYYFPVVVGMVDFDIARLDKNIIVLPFAKAQRLAGLEGTTQGVYVYANSRNDAGAIATLLGQTLPGRATLSIKPYTRHPYMLLIDMSNVMMGIIYITFMVVASFLIINTVIMVIHERIKEIGMMAALGMNRKEIVEVFFFESLFLSAIGSVVGCGAGAIVTYLLSRMPFDIGSIVEDTMAMNDTLFVSFSPAILAQGLAYGLGVSALCTILPSLKSAFVKPVEALRR